MTLWCSTSLKLCPGRARQAGSALIIALFILVVMSLLTAGLINMLQDSSRNVAWEVLGTRAELAATSGLEQALAQLYPLDADPATSCEVIRLSDLSGEGLVNCSVSLSCAPLYCDDGLDCSLAEGNEAIAYALFELTATGECGEGLVAVQRVQRVQARNSL